MKFQFIVDNKTETTKCMGEWGLSILIETGEKKILLDTGMTDLYAENAANLGINLKEVDGLVISHGHFDHTGGVPFFVECNETAPVYLHRDALFEAYGEDDGAIDTEPCSIRWSDEEMDNIWPRIQFTSGVTEIRINGKPLKSLTPEELHSRVGVVFQSDFLMADTLRENIRFGRQIADPEIFDAIECAQAGFIYQKEGVLDHELNVKGRNLSGGQQQRVLISRALAGDPRILLLDDCSSALDFRTDRALRHALRERHGQATTIIVAQRVSAVMAADKILVMDKGHIVQQGTHAELYEHCPMYRELCQIQLGGDAA